MIETYLTSEIHEFDNTIYQISPLKVFVSVSILYQILYLDAIALCGLVSKSVLPPNLSTQANSLKLTVLHFATTMSQPLRCNPSLLKTNSLGGTPPRYRQYLLKLCDVVTASLYVRSDELTCSSTNIFFLYYAVILHL